MIYINIPHTMSEHLNVDLWIGLLLRRNSFLIQLKIFFACLPHQTSCLINYVKKVKNKWVTWPLKLENTSEKRKREVNCFKYTRKALCIQKLIPFSPNQYVVLSTENYQRTIEYKAQKITAVITTCNCAAVISSPPSQPGPLHQIGCYVNILGLKD